MTANCLDRVGAIYASLKVTSVNVTSHNTRNQRQSIAPVTRVKFLVKHKHGVSLDEAPLIEAFESASTRAGVIAEFEEYEPLSDRSARGGGQGYQLNRAERLSKMIKTLYERGEPFVAMFPSTLAPALISKLTPDLVRVLEESPQLHVSVEYENFLYLPLHNHHGTIEIVGKRNSLASYKRVEILERKAASLGLLVTRQVYLDSNREILEYILDEGAVGPLRRIPVTKLAIVITGVYNCLSSKPPVNPYVITENADHTIVMVGVPEYLRVEIEDAVSSITNWKPQGGYVLRFVNAFKPYVEALLRTLQP